MKWLLPSMRRDRMQAASITCSILFLNFAKCSILIIQSTESIKEWVGNCQMLKCVNNMAIVEFYFSYILKFSLTGEERLWKIQTSRLRRTAGLLTVTEACPASSPSTSVVMQSWKFMSHHSGLVLSSVTFEFLG